jgi:hypothetical protein
MEHATHHTWCIEHVQETGACTGERRIIGPGVTAWLAGQPDRTPTVVVDTGDPIELAPDQAAFLGRNLIDFAGQAGQ